MRDVHSKASSSRIAPLLLIVTLALLQPSCGGRTESTSQEAPDTATAESTAAAAEEAPAPAPEAPQSKGVARVSIKGGDVNVDGEFPATRCGEAAMGTSGVVYETRPPGWNLSVMNWDHRIAGRQSGEQGGKSGMILNGTDGRSFTTTANTGAEITFGDDFKTAQANATVKAIGGPTTVVITAEFKCP